MNQIQINQGHHRFSPETFYIGSVWNFKVISANSETMNAEREVQIGLTFNQYIVGTYSFLHAGNSSFSTKLSNFSLLAPNGHERPSAWVSWLIESHKKYLFGKVREQKQKQKHGTKTLFQMPKQRIRHVYSKSRMA